MCFDVSLVLAKGSLGRTCSHAIVGPRCSRAVEDIHYIAWIIPIVFYIRLMGCSIGVVDTIGGPLHYLERRLIGILSKVSKPRGLYLELSDRSAIWQASTYRVTMIIDSIIKANIIDKIRASKWHILPLHMLLHISIVKWMPHFISIHALTHWDRLTHICVSKLTIVGIDNGLSPGRRQAIIWTIWTIGILSIRPLGTTISEILGEIHTYSFKKMHSKISSAKWRQLCLQCV